MSRRGRSYVAALASVCLVAAACGSDGPGVAADDGPQYGATLDEWTAANGSDGGGEGAAPLSASFQELDWEDLVAPGFSGEDISAQFTERLAEVDDGSPEAEALYDEMRDQYDDGAVNEELDGSQIQLAGFIAPLTYEDDIVTEFLLVPYFGACIHVPPPPPHQTVLVSIGPSSDLKIEDSWGAIWVTGTLNVSPSTTDLATASYTITNAAAGVYDDF